MPFCPFRRTSFRKFDVILAVLSQIRCECLFSVKVPCFLQFAHYFQKAPVEKIFSIICPLKHFSKFTCKCRIKHDLQKTCRHSVIAVAFTRYPEHKWHANKGLMGAKLILICCSFESNSLISS